MRDDSFKTKLVRIVTVALLVIVVVGGFVLVWPTYCKERSFKAKSDELDAQIAEKREEIAELKDKQRRFSTDPDFVESIARQNRRVYPGEIVFVFKDGKDAK